MEIIWYSATISSGSVPVPFFAFFTNLLESWTECEPRTAMAKDTTPPPLQKKGLISIGAEYGALDKVPAESRIFGFFSQFWLWAGAAALPAAWYYGALMAGMTGLGGALLLIFVFNTLIFIPWAYLGHIAADTGACSMAMVRPAFGLRGSRIPSIFYLIFGLGWGAVNVFLGSIAISFVFKLTLGWPAFLEPGFEANMVASILVACLLQGVLAVAGHRAIRTWQIIAGVTFTMLAGFQTYMVLTNHGFFNLFQWKPPQQGLPFSFGPLTYTITLALLIDLLVAYNWTWEFIGDFSRFAKSKFVGTWGPFLGANVSQYWWFTVGAMGVIAVALSTGKFDPTRADPSSLTTLLGFGWIAYTIILFQTIDTNAANIYASALAISNMFPKLKLRFRKILAIVAASIVPLSLVPLLSPTFVGFYILWLDFLGAIVVPLWVIALVDYFLVKKRNYSDDLFRVEGGLYWYSKGWNWPAIVTLIAGTVFYFLVAYGAPRIREAITATLPTVVFVAILYYSWGKRAWVKNLLKYASPRSKTSS